MKEQRAVGPNLKSYYYYTNESAQKEDIKGIIVIATGMEGTGALYDEIGEYLDQKGYALYTNDELGYGKTGKIVEKTGYKNWKRKDSYYAAYNIHGLVCLAKEAHPGKEVCLIGNDFGAMLSLLTVRHFPENVDKLVTIGWGTPRPQDYGLLLTAYIRKFFLFDFNKSKIGHFGKNKRLALRFERDDKYSWLTSDKEQLAKIKAAGYLDTPGSIGHYFHYYARKVRVPTFMILRKCNKDLPMLFISGHDDLTTQRGRRTKILAAHYKLRKFTNVTCSIVDGRHELLFEKNRFENVDNILNWIEGRTTQKDYHADENEVFDKIEVVGHNKVETAVEKEPAKKTEQFIDVSILEEADDDLRIVVKK